MRTVNKEEDKRIYQEVRNFYGIKESLNINNFLLAHKKLTKEEKEEILNVIKNNFWKNLMEA